MSNPFNRKNIAPVYYSGVTCIVDRQALSVDTVGTTLTLLHTLVVPANVLVEDSQFLLIQGSGVGLGALGTKSFSLTHQPSNTILIGLSTIINNNQGWHLSLFWQRMANNRVIVDSVMFAGGDYGVGGIAPNTAQTQRDITIDPTVASTFEFRGQVANAGDTVRQFLSSVTVT